MAPVVGGILIGRRGCSRCGLGSPPPPRSLAFSSGDGGRRACPKRAPPSNKAPLAYCRMFLASAGRSQSARFRGCSETSAAVVLRFSRNSVEPTQIDPFRPRGLVPTTRFARTHRPPPRKGARRRWLDEVIAMRLGARVWVEKCVERYMAWGLCVSAVACACACGSGHGSDFGDTQGTGALHPPATTGTGDLGLTGSGGTARWETPLRPPRHASQTRARGSRYPSTCT